MRNRIVLLCIVVTACGLSACSSKKGTLAKPAEVNQQSSAAIQKRQPQSSPLHRKAVSLLEKKSYRQAVELLNGRYHDGFENDFILAVNGQLKMGEDAILHGDYISAASAFKVVLNAYPPEPALRERVSHDPKRIRAILETCSNRIMEQGLDEYRRGRLEGAIVKWKVVLSINPGHHEARKSIDTATTQLQALQNIKSK